MSTHLRSKWAMSILFLLVFWSGLFRLLRKNDFVLSF